MLSLVLLTLFVCMAGARVLTRHLDTIEEPNATLVQDVVSRSLPNAESAIYSYVEVGGNISLPNSWVDVEVSVVNGQKHTELLNSQLPTPRLPGNVSASFYVMQPVYVSLTTMASRLRNVNTTILGLIQARIVPDRIYLLISKDAYLLDGGVKNIPDHLLCLAAAGYLSIVYTSNMGPHRKLLPVLHRYWNKDVFIATVDDDMSRSQAYAILYQLLKTYVHNNSTDSVVALRARRISVCNTPPYRATRYFSWPVVMAYHRQEMLLMPTGTGGILYKPSYFHRAIFMQSFWLATGTADDLMFRLATMMNDIPVVLGCSMLYHRGQVARSCKYDAMDKAFDAAHGDASSTFYKVLLAEALAQIQKSHADSKRNSTLPIQVNNAQPVQAHSLTTPLTLPLTPSLALPLTPPLAPTMTPPLTPPATSPSATTNSNAGNNAENKVVKEQTPEEKEVAKWQKTLGSVLQAPPRQLTSSSCGGSGCMSSECIPNVSTGVHTSYATHTTHGTHTTPTSTTRKLATKDLFSINRRGGNDHAWKQALSVLKSQQFSFENVTTMHLKERESFCFATNRTVRVERLCGLFDCKNKPKTITSVVLK